MGGILKLEISDGKNVMEIFQAEPGKLTFIMYPEDPKNEAYLEIVTDTQEFMGLLKKLLE